MVVELLANKIRNTKEIKGIKIGTIEIKIIQMADDTTVFVEDLNSLNKTLEIIESFHLFAGLKLNKSKTEAMWLGSWRNCDSQPLELTWVKEVHSLGIFFSYNTDYVAQKNFSDKAKAFERVLNLWSQRDLSLIGKIALLKSLAFSLITYQCCSLTVPDCFMETVIKLAFNFLWSGKKDKIKRKTIIADYNKGGLKMLDLKAFIIAQRTMWVKRLLKPGNASWKAYPEYILNNLLGMNSFKTSLDTTTNNLNLDPFYWTIVKSWNITTQENNSILDTYNIRRQWLWLNKQVKINKKVIKWKNWMEHGINIIHDILNSQGAFLTVAEMEERYKIKVNFLQYNSLKDAIPKPWRDTLKSITVARDAISSEEPASIIINKKNIPVQLISNKMIYWELIGKIQIPPITKDKWTQLFNLNKEDWENVFNTAKVIRDTKIRTFQYKLLFNLMPCNLYLFKIGKSNTERCQSCNKVDNITHYFYECPETRNFWQSFQIWWNNMTKEQITITMKTAILGALENNPNIDKINAVLQIARWYIYLEKLNLKATFFYKFQCLLKYKIKIERIICQKNNQMKHFERIWQDIEMYLD
jgi:hypothetical protein